MSKLIFKDLYLFSSSEKLARHISFNDGINVISSSQINGNDRGKSIVMRGLYHTLGADCQFDDNWDDKSKTYILHFFIDNSSYYIYRSNRLFKFFDGNKNLSFTCIERSELASNLKQYFGFATELPNRKSEQLEITPVCYNYLLSFVDQDCYNGTNFTSFHNLGQYKDYKENVLYYHFGAFDGTYYEVKRLLEELKNRHNDLQQQLELASNLFERTTAAIHGNTYAKSIEKLNIELERVKDEYANLVQLLSSLKEKLIELRNQKFDLEKTRHDLAAALKGHEHNITSLSKHICPFCHSPVGDTLDLRVRTYNSADDIILVSSTIQQQLVDITEKISATENRYRDALDSLKNYENRLKINEKKIDNVLRHRGYIEIRDNLLAEINELRVSISTTQAEIGVAMKRLREYEVKKKEINNEYYKMLLQDRNTFGLDEIDDKRFSNIKMSFKASGGNRPIATLIWYMTLNKLKNKFNPDAIKFPLVFDSPNNAELDDNKKREVLSYLIGNATSENQMIISSIGFSPETFPGITDITITTLTNDKYHLLCSEDYDAHKDLLIELCNA